MYNNTDNSNLMQVTKALLYALGIVLTAFLLALSIWNLAADVLALGENEVESEITVSENETIGDLAADLKGKGLINHKWLFQLFAECTGKSSKMVAGTYTLNTSMDYNALLTNVSTRSTTRETVSITVPEGYTANETMELLEEYNVCSVSDLEQAVLENWDEFEEEYPFLEWDENETDFSLEGFLFPDTYEFYTNETPSTVLKRFLTNFDAHLSDEMKNAIDKSKWSIRDIIIIASFIEKETDGTDQANISSVIYNRLNNPDNGTTNGYLQMDSTVQFALPERKETLTSEDLKVDSLYNTYLYPGLPIGPICNPGITAISAAIYPNDTDYYYFVLGSDGKTHFFETAASFSEYVSELEESTTRHLMP